MIREWKEMKDEKTLHKKGTKNFGGISNLSIKLKPEEQGYDNENKHRQSQFNNIGPNLSP